MTDKPACRFLGIISVVFPLAVFAVVVLGLGAALLPVLLAALLSYLFYPIVKKLETRGVSAAIAASIVLFVALILFAGILMIFVPFSVRELKGLIADLPRIVEVLLLRINAVTLYFGFEVPVTRADLLALASDSSGINFDIFKSATQVFGRAFSSVLATVFFFFNLLLMPVFYFFFTIEHQRMVRAVRALVPESNRASFKRFAARSNEIIGGYFRGQLIVALTVGSIYGIGYTFVGLRYGFLIGLITGFLHAVPYVGPGLGVAAATLIGLANFEHLGSVLWIWLVFFVGQTLESFVITPRVVGGRVGLTSLETIMVLMVAGNLGGFAAMLFAIPLGGITKVLLISCRDSYLKSDYFL